MIKVKNLNLEIVSKKILQDISFEVKSGEIFNILGHNGS
jgi:ABC-type cobalamin/Fe3+-siderophores transport system ATPase subunit